MKYKIRQKIFSFGDNFTIKDENDEPQFIVRGKVFALGDKLKLEDLAGNELIAIEQKLLRFLPEYNIFHQGKHMAMVKKAFTFFKPKFTITSSTGTMECPVTFLAIILKSQKTASMWHQSIRNGYPSQIHT
ncbi:LURP-one-related family protein [Serpentinicella sp. ANB-PHB4]|uniref:LURP-one-related/scramblase family protein n=1 Tax=Serpentinicella sp. ANB-PHB4 TaxID=3074076 RepID=UPI0028582213|nr:LURP-one-related family protein [Serpentinicella sp. ANB-PHB4]MDR5658494.1 LURP-one-related family protein [Serpentinicella sp. ANB-PHB4]